MSSKSTPSASDAGVNLLGGTGDVRALLSCFQPLEFSVFENKQCDRHTCSTVAGGSRPGKGHIMHFIFVQGSQVGMGITRWPCGVSPCASYQCQQRRWRGWRAPLCRRADRTSHRATDRRPTSRSRRLVRCTRPVGRTNSSKRTSSPGIKGEVRDEVERARETSISSP